MRNVQSMETLYIHPMHLFYPYLNPLLLIGIATRVCNDQGQWQVPDVLGCVDTTLTDVIEMVSSRDQGHIVHLSVYCHNTSMQIVHM